MADAPKVISVRGMPALPSNAIYIGRRMARRFPASAWGNPYPARRGGQGRDEAIRLYRSYITPRLISGELPLMRLRGKDLACWCAPKACHGDYLLALANAPLAPCVRCGGEGYYIADQQHVADQAVVIASGLDMPSAARLFEKTLSELADPICRGCRIEMSGTLRSMEV